MSLDSNMAKRIAKEFLASRGNQTNRKDKDNMSDTGGSSKGRLRSPNHRSPREDKRNRYKPKRKPKEELDQDTDLDPDNRAD